MPYIESGPVRLYFEEYGRGYPIIFVHEFESDLSSWEAQVDEDCPCPGSGLTLKARVAATGLMVCPNTSHAFNLDESETFEAHVEGFISGVERVSRDHRDRSKKSASSYDEFTATRLHFGEAFP